jgi:Flp pilus assembly protein TadG
MRRCGWVELRSCRGTSAVEFAAIGSLACTLLFGAMETARYQFTLQALRNLAGESTRIVGLQGAANMTASQPPCTGLSGPLARPSTSDPFLNPTSLKVTMSGCVTQGAVTLVTVTVSHPFSFVTPLIKPFSTTLTETAQAVFN